MRVPSAAVWLLLCLGACVPEAAATEGICVNAALRVEANSSLLPDCRAYELVTPPYKEGAPVQSLSGEFAVSEDGTHLIGTSVGTFAGSEEAFGPGLVSSSSRLNGTAYEFSRTATGWQASALAPPESRYADAGMYDASADLSSTLWGLSTPAQAEGVSDLYLEQPRGRFVEIGPPTPDPTLANAGAYGYLGASADLSHVLFSTQAGYRWSFDQTMAGSNTLYEYDGTGNSAPSLVGVSGGAGSTALISQCGTLLGSSGVGEVKGSVYNAVSASGSRVFFTAVGKDDQECGGQQPAVDELLARETGPAGEIRTVAISEPSREDCEACIVAPPDGVRDAVFQGASLDGSKVFFTSAQRLLDGASEGETNLYEYDFDGPAAQKLALVSAGSESAQVQGVARISEDGSHVYFVAKGVLDSAASAGVFAASGQNNLYVYERDAQFPAGRTSFIATLSPADAADWARADARPVLASQDGRYLVFSSQADLLGEGLAPGVARVFQYDALTGALVRASSGQDSIDDNSGATLATQQADSFDSPTTAAGMSAPADGAVFFASADALTPRALSDQSDALGEPVPNVYEYRAGSVFLVSDGRDSSAIDGGPGVRLLGSDPSGGDVFFTTVDSLVGQDTDTQQDIYDARVEGGFPMPAVAPGCFGEACQGPLSPPPLVTTADSPPASFEIADFDMRALGSGETPDTQAGGHPNSLTTSFDFTTTGVGASERSAEDVKDVVLYLPMGLGVDAQAAPRCPLSALQLSGEETACPASSRIGTLGLRLSGEELGSQEHETAAVYNVVTEAGYPLEFGTNYRGHRLLIYGSVVRLRSGYGLRLAVPGVSSLGVIGASLTLFGDPAQQDGVSESAPSLLTNPVDCAGGPLSATLEVDTWQHPGQYHADETVAYSDIAECAALLFQPTLAVAPEVTQADEPAGYELRIAVPQIQDPFSPATPELKQALVVLPAGVSLSPATADGLVSCAATGPEGINIGSGEVGPAGQDLGDPQASELAPDGLYRTVPGHCPSASTVGTVEISTPLLAVPLEGDVYLAQPECSGKAQLACAEGDAEDGRLFDLYLEAAGSGIVVKLAGHVTANPATGQLTLSFAELPQLPIGELTLRFKGGPRAPLANPQTCGAATANSDLSPWSSPPSFDAVPQSAFPVDWNGAGEACPGTLPFEPTLNSDVVTPSAGSFTALTLTISRVDREQYLSRFDVQLPPGLTWMFSSVPLCGETQGDAGTCFPASEIGTTEVALGAGSHPLWLPGRVYLTGGYRGAPYGLSIPVQMVAGPFKLGVVIVRAAIGVAPGTGALTISFDPLPQILDGVPLRIQTVEMDIDRPELILNPTICAARQIAATIEGGQGTTVEASNPLVTPGCQSPPSAPVGQAGPTTGQASTTPAVVHKRSKKKGLTPKRKPKKKRRKQGRKIKHDTKNHGKHGAKAKKGKRGHGKRS
jgi:hypothetical protein